MYRDASKRYNIWHSLNECKCCNSIMQISREEMALLQHHFKFLAIYPSYYHVTMLLEEKINQELCNRDNTEEAERYLYLVNPREICHKAKFLKWNLKGDIEINHLQLLLDYLAKMSEDLIGPDQEDQFNCNNYEIYLRCLRKVVLVMEDDNKNENKDEYKFQELLEDLEKYLLPYNKTNEITSVDETPKLTSINEITSVDETPKLTSIQIEWLKTFVNLEHENDDEGLVEQLRNILWKEPANSRHSLFPEQYQNNCHVDDTRENMDFQANVQCLQNLLKDVDCNMNKIIRIYSNIAKDASSNASNMLSFLNESAIPLLKPEVTAILKKHRLDAFSYILVANNLLNLEDLAVDLLFGKVLLNNSAFSNDAVKLKFELGLLANKETAQQQHSDEKRLATQTKNECQDVYKSEPSLMFSKFLPPFLGLPTL